MTIVVAILALSLIIIVHETGHFLAARAVGIKVLEFSLFMGPKLFSFERKGTVYSIRAIPIGGFVSMEGEEKEVESETSYSSMPAYKKIITIAAGPMANFIFAILILFILFLSSGYALDGNTKVIPESPAYEAGIRDGDEIISIDGRRVYDPLDLTILLYTNDGREVEVVYESGGDRKSAAVTPAKTGGVHHRVNFVPEDGTNVVGDIEEDSNGYEAGLRPGDRIIGINGRPMSDRYDIDEYMKSFEGGMLEVEVERDGTVFMTSFEAVKVEEPSYRDIGVYYTGSPTNPWTALKHSVKFSISTVRSVLMSLAWLVSGTVKFSEMMGPVGIVSTMGETIRQDTFRMFIINLANMTAFISLNLGLINLIPFPALDGSRIVIHIIEGIRKKPFPMEKTAWITIAGFVLLIALLVFATFNDVMRLIGLR